MKGDDVTDYDFVRFTVIDVVGQSRSKLVPVKQAIKYVASHNINIISIAIGMGYHSKIVDLPILHDIGYPSYILTPVPDGLRKLPWASEKYNICEYICEMTYQLPRPLPLPMCPRFIARRQVELLKSEFGLVMRMSYEMEFVVTCSTSSEPVFSGNEIFSTQIMSTCEPMICDLLTMLEAADIEVEAFHCEYTSGCFEIAFVPQLGINMADDITRVKSGIKQFFTSRGYRASFMTRQPDTDLAVSLQMNMSLLDDKNRNVFIGKDGGPMSEISEHWIAGILKFMPSFTVLHCPTVNCYRRLHQPWSPHKADWGHENRYACLRVRNIADACIENRIPSSSVNPYLSLAAILVSGMKGLREKLPIPEENQQDAVVLPHSLEEALQLLNDDKEAVQMIGAELVEWFTIIKTESEIDLLRDVDLKENISQKEIDMYQLYA